MPFDDGPHDVSNVPEGDALFYAVCGVQECKLLHVVVMRNGRPIARFPVNSDIITTIRQKHKELVSLKASPNWSIRK